MEPSIPDTNATKYVRYRFKTKSVDDPRPLQSLKPIQCPYWISGYASDRDFELTAMVIVCYLPVGTDLHEYWDDAFDVSSDPADSVEYSARFPKPGWLR